MSEAARSQKERKDTYESVLNTIEYNTGGTQRAGMSRVSLYNNRLSANEDLEDVRKAVRAARENGDLISWCDDEGKLRYARTTDEALLDVITDQVTGDGEPNRDLVARCNELREVGDER